MRTGDREGTFERAICAEDAMDVLVAWNSFIARVPSSVNERHRRPRFEYRHVRRALSCLMSPVVEGPMKGKYTLSRSNTRFVLSEIGNAIRLCINTSVRYGKKRPQNDARTHARRPLCASSPERESLEPYFFAGGTPSPAVKFLAACAYGSVPCGDGARA